ncbi:MAG: prephenate dehydratase [bacterium]|nr:prephenate dehydratase [bacterium]
MTENAGTYINIAYQGIKGAYSEEAAMKYFGGNGSFIPCRSFEDVFEKVSEGEAEAGVLPIENSFTGAVYQNYDLLQKSDLWIAGETYIRIQHNLIAHPGAKIEDIKKVYSHPQGLGQCRKFLNSHPGIEQIAASNTAESVLMIKEKGWNDSAAVAGKNAAGYYEMEILEESIEDIEQNYTRFLILTKERNVPKGADKTSVVYSVKNIPGALYKSLSVFALRDISLSKIESRPLHGKPWEYFFYVDIDESIVNKNCNNALNHLREIADYLKVLGSYCRMKAS